MARKGYQDGEPIVIKKYANRRLYNTATSSYVTLEHLADMIKEDEEFVVRDAKTGEDLTRTVLAQIIFDRESKDKTLLSLPFLRQLIGLYGEGMQTMVPAYLQSAMETLTRNQDSIKKAMVTPQGPGGFMPLFEELTRQNMTLLEQTMHFFTPQTAQGRGDSGETEETLAAKDREIDELKAQLANLASKVDALSTSKK